MVDTSAGDPVAATWPDPIDIKPPGTGDDDIDPGIYRTPKIFRAHPDPFTKRKPGSDNPSVEPKLMTPPAPKGAIAPMDDPPPPPSVTGCCYYTNSPPVPNLPEELCVNDPNYLAWVGGAPCPVC